jgi:uncharacterized repeat protein (TIGR01451 family)
VTYDETITVAPTNAGGVTLNCTVTFELNGAPGGPDFEQHTAVTVNGADLSITKTGPAFAQSGGTITYNITAHNSGPAKATGVTVNDPLPAGETLVSATRARAPVPTRSRAIWSRSRAMDRPRSRSSRT